jgi:LPXTG-motif cell wall-anchored protein
VRYRFRYPDAPHDAETLLVDPVSSRIYIATKTYGGFTALYMAPLHPSAGRIEWLVELSSRSWTPHPGSLLDVPAQLATTGGAFSPDGRSFVLRTYTDAYLFRLRGLALADVAAALVGAPERIRLPGEPQGEGIGFRRDGKALVIDSEGVGSAVDEVLLPQAVPSRSTGSPPTSSGGSSARPRRAAGPTPTASISPARAASKGSTGTRLVAPVVAGLLLAGLVAVVARRRRAEPARSSR